jgi:superoxide dismutase, Fe-Mn family
MLTSRRQALKTLTAAAIATTAFGRINVTAETPAPTKPDAAPAPTGPFVLPPLPYAYDALEPYIDAETMHLHHDKHHKAYVTKLNEAMAKEPSFKPPIDVDDLMKALDAVPESIRTAVRNQGGGHANHSLFWRTLMAQDSAHQRKVSTPSKTEFSGAVKDDLGGLSNLMSQMSEQGSKLFGSGWVWLVLDGGRKLTIMTLPNQDSPLTEGHYPLFGIDVWEHAYYLKYKNVRADYLAAIWNVVNWDFISDRYAAAMKA